MHIDEIISGSGMLNGSMGDSSINSFKAAGIDNDDKKASKIADAPLRSINIDQPFYHANNLKEKSLVDDLESRLNSNASGKDIKERMALAASSMTKQDFSKMEEDGFSPMDMDEEKMVTIADKIRMQLAKAGADISAMGGLSDDEIRAMSGSDISAVATENAIATSKAQQIESISEDAKKYLVQNELEPTIDNIYKATYSVSEKYDSANPSRPIDDAALEAIDGQIKGTISEAGLEVNEESIDVAKKLIKDGIPLTADSLRYYSDLSSKELENSKEEIASRIQEAVSEGKRPQDAYMISGYSSLDRAKEAQSVIEATTAKEVNYVMEADKELTIRNLSMAQNANINTSDTFEDVNAKRVLEEIRLTMSVEANYSLIRKGVAIDTLPLASLVEELKAQESLLYQKLLGDDSTNISLEEKIKLFDNTNQSIQQLKQMPVAALSVSFESSAVSVKSVYESAKSLEMQYKQAGERYETMQTEVRKDLGDSIKKAFRNVDDILSDLGLEASESNERAVRILGYNRLDITKENILSMKTVDEQMQRVFKGLTPGVVANMIKEGTNPLDMSLDELNQKIEELKDRSDSRYDADEFAKFLWKAERSGELSPEERESFIGIYRLMHQVTKSDGAVIGHLLNQGAEVTMRNMMMAIRTAKSENKETVIDDNFGFVSDFKKEDLSITEQIEMVFQTARMRDAKEAANPANMAQIGQDNIMNMTPDELATALESYTEDPMEDAYKQEQINVLRQAVESDKEMYSILKNYDIPTTPANIQAISAFYANRNGMVKNIFERKSFSHTLDGVDLDNINPEEIMLDIIKDFGEAVKTPEDMAKAQQKLAETAENVMKNMLVEVPMGSFDVNGMKVAVTQLRMMGQISRDSENYTIPIMVADETGTLSLKIVRGSEDNKGLVDIAFDMEATGPVNATFRYEVEGIRGTVSCAQAATREAMEAAKDLFTNRMSQLSGETVSIAFGNNKDVMTNNLLNDYNPGFDVTNEKKPIMTSKLYGMAKGFIDTIGEIF